MEAQTPQLLKELVVGLGKEIASQLAQVQGYALQLGLNRAQLGSS